MILIVNMDYFLNTLRQFQLYVLRALTISNTVFWIYRIRLSL
jgi:hypothetical protein